MSALRLLSLLGKEAVKLIFERLINVFADILAGINGVKCI
jgi:hypothetical protein